MSKRKSAQEINDYVVQNWYDDENVDVFDIEDVQVAADEAADGVDEDAAAMIDALNTSFTEEDMDLFVHEDESDLFLEDSTQAASTAHGACFRSGGCSSNNGVGGATESIEDSSSSVCDSANDTISEKMATTSGGSGRRGRGRPRGSHNKKKNCRRTGNVSVTGGANNADHAPYLGISESGASSSGNSHGASSNAVRGSNARSRGGGKRGRGGGGGGSGATFRAQDDVNYYGKDDTIWSKTPPPLSKTGQADILRERKGFKGPINSHMQPLDLFLTFYDDEIIADICL